MPQDPSFTSRHILLSSSGTQRQDRPAAQTVVVKLSAPKSSHGTSVETFVKASGTAIALVYATGFLINFTHAQRLGIGDEIVDLFRAKHMLVGTLYWLIPVLFGIPSWAYTTMYLRNRKINAKRRPGDKEPMLITLTGLLTSLQLLGLIYIVTLVAPPHFLSRQAVWVELNFLISVVILGIIYFFMRAVRNPETYKRQNRLWKGLCFLSSRDWLLRRHCAYSAPGSWRGVRAMLLLLTLVIDWRCLEAEGLVNTFGEMLWNAKILIAIFLFMGFLPYQYWDRSRRANHRSDKNSLWYACAAYLLALYVFSVIGFAYALYPFIPAERGGGNYTHSPDVQLHLKSQPETVPNKIIERNSAGILISKPVKLIEQSSSWIYISLGPDEHNPAHWKPDIMAIRKELVVSMIFVVPDQRNNSRQ
jgi:hypothetical protein